MKRFLGLLLAFIMVLSLVPSVYANPQITLRCNLTSDEGQNVVIKRPNDVITVTYSLENVTNVDDAYKLLSHTNEIYFDPAFFQYEEGSAVVTSGLNLGTSFQKWSWGERSVSFAGFEPDVIDYDSKQIIGTFRLKIITTEENTSSTIYSQNYVIGSGTEDSSGNDEYSIVTEDLVVIIGNAVPVSKYTLNFETNGGTSISSIKRNDGTVVDLLNYNPVKPGFVLEGWYSDPTFNNKITSILLDENKTVYAKWKEAVSQYTLTFNTNGGSPIASEKENQGTVIDLTQAKYQPIKAGYIFEGWYSDSALENKVTEVTLNANTTVYAKWKSISVATYTLTFETNGGSSIASITANDGDVIDISSKKPTKTGYSFVGWYTEAGFINKVTSVTLNKNTTVYAKWKESTDGGGGGGGGGGATTTKYTITFETNGGSEITSVSKEKDTTVDLVSYVPTKEGFSFDGWYTDENLTNRVTSVNVTSNITLYAKWTPGDNGSTGKPSYRPDIFTGEHIAYVEGKPGGYIAPNDSLTRAEAATMFFRLLDKQVYEENVTDENNFVDVNKGEWFNTAISTLANLGVLKGRTVDTFAPNETITRAEFMTIVARLSEATYSGEDKFSDIAGHWANNYINIAASIGWAKGDNGKFRPDDNITRAEAMTVINRALDRLPENTSDLLEGMHTFVDNNDVNAWYYLNVQEATNGHSYMITEDGVHEKWTSLNNN